MRTIHPFPARMAPELALKAIKTLPLGSSVLDPMCGSGTSLKIAADLGIRAVGVDLDPMATLISSVWSRNFETDSLETKLKLIVHAARDFESSAPITSCAETNNFIAFWFGPKQAAALHAISTQIHDIEDESDRNFFSVALSRIIITKVVGASLAWDVSHSRPHRKKIVNDFDTIEGFEKSSRWMIRYFDEHEVLMPASVLQNDARHFKLDEKFDLVVTSPPSGRFVRCQSEQNAALQRPQYWIALFCDKFSRTGISRNANNPCSCASYQIHKPSSRMLPFISNQAVI